MQFGNGGTPPVGVVFDGAFERIGDILALAVLYGLETKSEARVTGISVNRPDFSAAQFCDVVKRFYSGGFAIGIPVGVADGKAQPLPVYAKLLAMNGADGASLFKPALAHFLDSPDPATAMRNNLTASQSKNSIVIASGSLATVTRMLALRGSKLLVEETVRHLVIADPKIPSDAAERANCQKMLEEWPSPIYFCGGEIGEAIKFPGASIEKEFSGPKANPIADAYRAFGEMPYDAPALSADAGLFAVRLKANLFQVSEPGTLRISAAGKLELEPSPAGKHHRVSVDEAQKANVVKALTELASAPPRPPTGRGRRGQAVDATPAPIKK
jgi:hypothetical protein